jgi:hypothetical protein
VCGTTGQDRREIVYDILKQVGRWDGGDDKLLQQTSIKRRDNMIWVAFDETNGSVVKVVKDATDDPPGCTSLKPESADDLATKIPSQNRRKTTHTQVIIHNSGCVIHGGVMYCW